MNEVERNDNLKDSLYPISMIFSVIGVRLVDEYVYEMHLWIGLTIAVLLSITLYKVIESTSKFDRKISKRMKTSLSVSTIIAIIIHFNTFLL